MAHRLKGTRLSHHHSGYLIEALTLPIGLLLVAVAAMLLSAIVHWS